MPKKTAKLPAKLVKYLEKAGIDHEVLEHKTVYTALDAAKTMKKKVNEIAKSLIVKADKDYFVVVLPADQNLNMDKLAKCIGTQKKKTVKTIKIPGEKIVHDLLKIKQGAVTAFGNMHKLLVIMEKNLTKLKKVVFSSGSFNHSLDIAVKDIVRLENAVLASFGIKKKIKKQKTTKPKRSVKKKTKKAPVKKKKAVVRKVVKKK